MASVYTSRAVCKVVGVSQRCLDYWDQREIVRPSVARAKGTGSKRLYAYDDLVKLKVVKELRANGLSLQRIRNGLAALKKKENQDDPLKIYTLITDGQKLHRLLKDPFAVEDVLSNGQLVFSAVALGPIDHEIQQALRKWDRKQGNATETKQQRRAAAS